MASHLAVRAMRAAAIGALSTPQTSMSDQDQGTEFQGVRVGESSDRAVRREKTRQPQYLGSWRRLDLTLDSCGVRCGLVQKKTRKSLASFWAVHALSQRKPRGAWACRIALSGD
jgi:hypothetical protein